MNKSNNTQEDVLKINGNRISVKSCALSSEERDKLISEIQSALNDHNRVIDDEKLQLVINTVMKHCFELLKMKICSANVDVFNVGSVTTCERNLWWIGGFRPSRLIQVIVPQLQHKCTQEQLCDIYKLGNSCEQAEYALAQGMIILDKAASTGDKEFQLTYLPQQLCFFKEADNIRQEFVHQFSSLFTITQQAEFAVALKEHLHNPQPRSSL